ncbi:MAG: hypothetical protein BWZ02_00796 [Lentisphaerae bacterium ADurb.BinA184]|nr:MAG: hypothetical protein BWZ02_00796 [Lentisphaerae bacterium ADurb.BinA184]
MAVKRAVAGVAVAVVMSAAASGWGALQAALPYGRTFYQTNEEIPVSVLRDGAGGVADMQMTLAGDDGFTAEARFAATRPAELLFLDARLLRPAHYRLTLSVGPDAAAVEFDVCSHVRRSSFRIINWGGNPRNKGDKQWSQGEDNLGYNLMLAHYCPYGDGDTIRAGVDYMRCCTQSGGHQMDLRMECDWSDPYVLAGGRRRVARQALEDRTRGNAIGVHFYDEPGLTWWNHPVTKEMTAHGIPAQVRSFIAAFDREPLSYHLLDPKNADHVAQWRQWAYWKLAFMDAAWKDAQSGVSRVRPDFLSVTQSQYGFSAFTDGYYSNVVRSLPVVSGHGGYHDWGPGYFNPSYTLEVARARDFAKPCWYLPAWYGNTTADAFRLEQYLSFQTNIQGMDSPPDMDLAEPDRVAAAPGIVESNKLMLQLGTVFNVMPVTRPPVALLFSLSHMVNHQATRDIRFAYAHADAHGTTLPYAYLAGKLLQQPFMVVLDEDITDGTLLADHKALILPSVDYLSPPVMTALEAFIRNGGLVLKTSDCELQLEGSVDIGMTPELPTLKQIEELKKAGQDKEAQVLGTMRYQLQAAAKMADAIKPHLDKAGIRPVFECDQPGIVATRQAQGDIEYLFAVNATHDLEGDPQVGVKAVTARIELPGDGRPVYDAVHARPEPGFAAAGGRLGGSFRFGPGQMRVFARTARPIGGVRVAAPIVHRDLAAAGNAVSLAVSAVVVDTAGGALGGAVPMRVRVLDPQGTPRYDLYRAAAQGVLSLSVPLGINEPPGNWQVTVQELLGGNQGQAAFAVAPLAQCASLVGTAPRAFTFLNDRDNIHRFFRLHQDVTLVTGASAYCAAAADRLSKILAPWQVRCTVVAAADVNRGRAVTEDEAATWCGITHTGRGSVKAGDGNPPSVVGYAVQGPVVLIGSPEDNPLIAFLDDQKTLPVTPAKGVFPGPGRGLVAWQADMIGLGQESIAVVAFDADGMGEAVGTLYEAAAGLEPLSPYLRPVSDSLKPPAAAARAPAPQIVWQAILPDRVDAIKADAALQVLTHDGTVTTLAADGKTASQKLGGLEAPTADAPTPDQAKALAIPGRVLKKAAVAGEVTAAGYWGGFVRVTAADGTVRAAHQFQHDIGAMAWLGDRLIVGLSDGSVVALTVK